MKVVAIIQARMASSRFPGKHLAPLNGKPMICHVVDRVWAPGVDEVVVATTVDRSDNPLVEYLASQHINCFRGAADHPLERMHRCAKENAADVIVRVTGDCPLVDFRKIAELVYHFCDSDKWAYLGVTNSPDGNDVEVFSEHALVQGYLNSERGEIEHTTTWIRKHMLCQSTEGAPQYADVHYSVNTVDDLKTCELLIQRCGEGAKWTDYVDAYRELRA